MTDEVIPAPRSITRISPPPKPAANAVRVAAYARVSQITGRSEKSLALQIAYYTKLIESTPGWVYAGVYADAGISGTSTKNREGFNDLIKAAHDGQVDIILTKSISRFARNTVDLLETCRSLKDAGVEVRFEKENLSTFSDDGELMLTLLASFAQAESEQLSQNTKWSVKKRFEKGLANGFHLYGYTDSKDATDVQIIEEEAQIIRRAYQNFLDGISPESTAKQFKDEGILSRNGVPFNPETIRFWLKHSSYTGTLTLQRWRTPGLGKHAVLNDGVEPMYTVEQAIPAIIDEATFLKVQRLRAKRRELGALANPAIPTSMFTHLVYCTHCERFFHTRKRTSTDGRELRWWVCRTKRDGKKGCPLRAIPQAGLLTACKQALGVEDLDEQYLRATVTRIDVINDGHLRLWLVDGSEIDQQVTYPTNHARYWTKEKRQARAEMMRQFWAQASQEERDKHIAPLRQPLSKRKMEARSEKLRASWTPERRAKQAEVARRVWANMSEEKKQAWHATAAGHIDDDAKERKSASLKKHWTPERRAEHSARLKAFHQAKRQQDGKAGDQK